MPDNLYIAVDLGAGSGRVCLVGFGPGELLLEEVRRFRYPPTLSAGHLRWDFSHIFDEVKNRPHYILARRFERGQSFSLPSLTPSRVMVNDTAP